MRITMLTLGLLACSADEKNEQALYFGGIVFEQDSNEGLCQAIWSFEGSRRSEKCSDCAYPLKWIYDITYTATEQTIPDDCNGSRIADYGSNPTTQTDALNTYSHLIGYSEEIEGQDEGVIFFGHTTDNGETLAPFAAADWSDVDALTWSRMGPNMIITERGAAQLID